MKRIVPLWIAALGGFVLIVSYFIPRTQGWGEVAAIWFDILAAIAFVLGGGNLLKIHLRKVSDRGKGWGYSVITAGSFLVMLWVGLVKWGAPPAPNGEHYGSTWASLDLESVPAVSEVDGVIPQKATSEANLLHHSVAGQVKAENGKISFRGWMNGDQKGKLAGHKNTLAWQCTVSKLHKAAQPAGELGPIGYNADHGALSFVGRMTDEQKGALLALGGDAEWTAAVNTLHEKSQKKTSILVDEWPSVLDASTLPTRDVSYEAGSKSLTVTGPLSQGQIGDLSGRWRKAKPIKGDKRAALLKELKTKGALVPEQETIFNSMLDGTWTPEQLRAQLDVSGLPQASTKSACELFEEQKAGMTDLNPSIPAEGEATTLNEAQAALLTKFADDDDMTGGMLAAELAAAGPFSPEQEAALNKFVDSLPTVGERNKALAFALAKEKDADNKAFGLNSDQSDLLLADYRTEIKWRQTLGALLVKSHEVKFNWSGEYRAQGAPFWWMYEYVFKPLQATIFAMLAFYVASAAFRAFRAKNVEAMLLLGTAFIILLGRTFAGVFLTAWMPEALSGLRIENLTVTIMKVFNTAGNRAIMIGIALGIASTSLKVLLGVDRSYLGSAEE